MLLKNVLSASARVVPLFGHYVLYFLSCTMGNAASVYYSRCKGAGPYLATQEVFELNSCPRRQRPHALCQFNGQLFIIHMSARTERSNLFGVAAPISISGECRDSDAGDVGCWAHQKRRELRVFKFPHLPMNETRALEICFTQC